VPFEDSVSTPEDRIFAEFFAAVGRYLALPPGASKRERLAVRGVMHGLAETAYCAAPECSEILVCVLGRSRRFMEEQ
jgi:hypothetical protein